MKNNYVFKSDAFSMSDFKYVYSPICKEFAEFKQEKNCIVNGCSEQTEYKYISIVTNKTYKSGTTITATCDFEKFGAPLIVISGDINKDENGRNRYGTHFEVVAYEEGVNIWHIVPYPERTSRPIKPTLIASARFKIEDSSKICMSLKVCDNSLIATVNGVEVKVEHSDVPKEFNAGITACEGINRFYDFSIME